MGTCLSATILEIRTMLHAAKWDTLTEDIIGLLSLKVNQSNRMRHNYVVSLIPTRIFSSKYHQIANIFTSML